MPLMELLLSSSFEDTRTANRATEGLIDPGVQFNLQNVSSISHQRVSAYYLFLIFTFSLSLKITNIRYTKSGI